MNHFIRNLKKEFHHHGLDYLLLTATGVIFLCILKIFQGQKLLSFLTTVSFVIAYIFWAIYHHNKQEIREFKNVLEYVLIGITVLLFIGLIFYY